MNKLVHKYQYIQTNKKRYHLLSLLACVSLGVSLLADWKYENV